METNGGRSRFMRLCGRMGISNHTANEAWSTLDSGYHEAHRYYHNFDHINAMLAAYDATGREDDSIEMAIWFHDAIYDPRSNTNERDSAALFSNTVGTAIDPETRIVIERLILATDPRRERSHDPAENFLIDIDLLVLSSNSDTYREYARRIREEYAHVTDDAFRQGRATVLAKYLQAPIYATEHFRPSEQAARKNLSAELEMLRE